MEVGVVQILVLILILLGGIAAFVIIARLPKQTSVEDFGLEENKHTLSKEPPNRNNIRLGTRLGVYFGLLLLGMLLCIRGIPIFLFYPSGIMLSVFLLTGFFPANECIPLIAGYSIYIALLIGFLISSKRSGFIAVIALMAIVTILNVAGCQYVLHYEF